MKVRVLMVALAAALMMGAQGFAMSPCDSACVDPCGACDRGAVKCDLFSGLKRLVNGFRSTAANCDPCDAVVACNPCDVVADCDPCGEVACDTPRFGLGGRLRNLFASSQAYTPCDVVADCSPCDVVADCDPCGIVDCGPKFTLRNPFRNLFNGLRLNRGCATDCGPCDVVGDCGPCDVVGDCGPCDNVCGDTSCGPRGHLFDLPRLNFGRLFNGIRTARCDDGACNPCDEVRPCDVACCR